MKFTERELSTIVEALDFWEEGLYDEDQRIMDESQLSRESPLSQREVRDLLQRFLDEREKANSSSRDDVGAELVVFVPTYVRERNLTISPNTEAGEYTYSKTPILIGCSSGLRLILGARDKSDVSKPDLLVERRPHGWSVFVHPNAGDPVAVLAIRDDGESFLVPANEGALRITSEIPRSIDLH
ncbi:hypothetical protein [Anatilimnocola floriformis]|uniref:hypothetical protein n=1 Tax=Anatilimnocola floriformis TaxID=2948575 RepID=UPI0020C26D1F|nr:hypothetical protein [Anatilimnocola floriformis]